VQRLDGHNDEEVDSGVQYRTSMLWHLLRMSRSRPPGLAEKDDRRADLLPIGY